MACMSCYARPPPRIGFVQKLDVEGEPKKSCTEPLDSSSYVLTDGNLDEIQIYFEVGYFVLDIKKQKNGARRNLNGMRLLFLLMGLLFHKKMILIVFIVLTVGEIDGTSVR